MQVFLYERIHFQGTAREVCAKICSCITGFVLILPTHYFETIPLSGFTSLSPWKDCDLKAADICGTKKLTKITKLKLNWLI